MRLAAIADLHVREGGAGQLRRLLGPVEDVADALALAGDLTDTGLPLEMEALLEDLTVLRLPVVAVLGNHDHESDHAADLARMLHAAGVHLLEGTVCEIEGVGFVGTKGFCGGFERHSVQPFGERVLKTFIQASIDEAVALENALAKLEVSRRVALLHYAPSSDTLLGEPPELYPFLGSSRLGGAVDRRGVDLILHGHAHHGCRDGRTPGGIPVCNVSRFVLGREGGPPYRLFDL